MPTKVETGREAMPGENGSNTAGITRSILLPPSELRLTCSFGIRTSFLRPPRFVQMAFFAASPFIETSSTLPTAHSVRSSSQLCILASNVRVRRGWRKREGEGRKGRPSLVGAAVAVLSEERQGKGTDERMDGLPLLPPDQSHGRTVVEFFVFIDAAAPARES